MKSVNKDIVFYIEEHILPQYENFDKAHNGGHVKKVIANSMEIAEDYKVDINIVYVIAAFHDLGLIYGRENHEINSGNILMKDKRLPKWFSQEEIYIMKEAAEDHRASNKNEPRTIYGKIIAEADREISYKTILTRTIQFSLSNSPHYSKEDHFKRCREHIIDKYGKNGYLKLWLSTRKNTEGLREIHKMLDEEEAFRHDFDAIYSEQA